MPSSTRRAFFGQSAAGLGLPFAAALGRGAAPPPAARAKKLLILGGTQFLGPATVEAAQRRGHEVTLFNRGKTNPGLFPEVEKLIGDRDGKLEALRGRKWDAVVDTSAYVPRHARLAAELLRDAVQHYVMISTISVYPKFGETRDAIDEDTAVGTLADESVEQVTGATYGPLKARCEQAVEAALPGRAAHVRPGLIVGPRDPTDRFTYWPARVHRGGEILAPGDGSAPVQFIDVRDLGEWIVHLIDNGITGTYNATGFDGRVSMQEFLHGCKCAVNHACSFTWVSEEFLSEQKVGAWMDLPLWLPHAGQSYCAVERAIAKGLRFRPIAETCADTCRWALAERGERPWRAGLKPEREAEVLAAWQARAGAR